ncbi:ASI1-immunoprecipitated protein 1 [Euphorbia lathyris]|uniref:ASI1-immunoprecipitated protein 1 n=1 Tax=Euphorbia lathyris TaxID=212925 RepID=UPI003313E6FD
MESTDEHTEYAKFEEKTSRTIYIDNLTPLATEVVLKTAIDQFGTVKSIQFIPNYLEPKNTARCALVEMDSAEIAKKVIAEIAQYPFMVCGMPRPVRARHAEPEMFEDHPKKPARRIVCRWVEPTDPDFQVANELKLLAKKHAGEASFLLTQQVDREEKLHKQQMESLKANYKKFEMIDGVLGDRTAQRLAEYYKIGLTEDL